MFCQNENKVTHEAPRLLKIIQTWLLDGHSACIRGNFAQIAIKKKKKIKSFPNTDGEKIRQNFRNGEKLSSPLSQFYSAWIVQHRQPVQLAQVLRLKAFCCHCRMTDTAEILKLNTCWCVDGREISPTSPPPTRVTHCSQSQKNRIKQTDRSFRLLQ